MSKNWPTQDDDMALASDIIDEHVDYNDGEPLPFYDVLIRNGEAMKIERPQWVIRLSDHFNDLYGEDIGNSVLEKVLMHYMEIEGHTVH